jgi:hypothetical protein
MVFRCSVGWQSLPSKESLKRRTKRSIEWKPGMKLIHQRCGNIEDYGEFHGNILSPRVIDVPDVQKKICKYKTDPDCRKKLETNISLCVIDAPDVQKKICK